MGHPPSIFAGPLQDFYLERINGGIQPEMARTLVELDTDLRGLVTRGTLQSGVEHALRRSAGARPSTVARNR